MPPIHFWGNSSTISNQFVAYSEYLLSPCYAKSSLVQIKINQKIESLGPKLPNGAVLVPYDDTVVAVGGSKTTRDYGTQIYKLTCPDLEHPTSECVWTELEQKLSNGRNYPVAMMIPDHFTSCKHSDNRLYRSVMKSVSSFLVSI